MNTLGNTIKYVAIIFVILAVIGFVGFAYEYNLAKQAINKNASNNNSNTLFSQPMIGIVTPMAMEQAPIFPM